MTMQLGDRFDSGQKTYKGLNSGLGLWVPSPQLQTTEVVEVPAYLGHGHWSNTSVQRMDFSIGSRNTPNDGNGLVSERTQARGVLG